MQFSVSRQRTQQSDRVNSEGGPPTSYDTKSPPALAMSLKTCPLATIPRHWEGKAAETVSVAGAAGEVVVRVCTRVVSSAGGWKGITRAMEVVEVRKVSWAAEKYEVDVVVVMVVEVEVTVVVVVTVVLGLGVARERHLQALERAEEA